VRAGGPALLAASLAIGAQLLGLHGTDLAAQVYRVGLFRRHGFVLWAPGWYDGMYPPAYSVLTPAVAATVGIAPLLVVSATTTAACADRLLCRLLRRRPLGSWYLAASTLIAVVVGQLPYLAGEAAGAAALLLASAPGRRRLAAPLLGVLCALLSPLAGAFLVLIAGVWAVGAHRPTNATARTNTDAPEGSRPQVDPELPSAPTATLAATGVLSAGVIGLIGFSFPPDGPFPFAWGGLVVVELLCAGVATRLLPAGRTLRLGAVAYGLATLASFLVANPVGGNATRLAESVGIPLLVCFLPGRADPAGVATAPATLAPAADVPPAPAGSGPGPTRWGRRRRCPQLLAGPARRPVPRRVALAVLALAAVWQWGPATAVTSSLAPAPSDTASFYRPLEAELHARSDGHPIRVEVVPTRDHWEAAYVAEQFLLARGWERQLDVRDNPIFYRPHALDATSYLAWLRANGVSDVALADAPLDYAGRAEAALLRSGVPGLRVVWSSPEWTLWSVEGSPGLSSGPGSVEVVAPDHIVLDARRAGTLLLRVRFTRFRTLVSGDARLSTTPAGWTRVVVLRPGRVVIGASLFPGGPARTSLAGLHDVRAATATHGPTAARAAPRPGR